MLQTLQRFAETHLQPQDARYNVDFDTDLDVFWTEDMVADAARDTTNDAAEDSAQAQTDSPHIRPQTPARPVFGRRNRQAA